MTDSFQSMQRSWESAWKEHKRCSCSLFLNRITHFDLCGKFCSSDVRLWMQRWRVSMTVDFRGVPEPCPMIFNTNSWIKDPNPIPLQSTWHFPSLKKELFSISKFPSCPYCIKLWGKWVTCECWTCIHEQDTQSIPINDVMYTGCVNWHVANGLVSWGFDMSVLCSQIVQLPPSGSETANSSETFATSLFKQSSLRFILQPEIT